MEKNLEKFAEKAVEEFVDGRALFCFSCMLCGKPYKTKGFLTNHIKDYHKEE